MKTVVGILFCVGLSSSCLCQFYYDLKSFNDSLPVYLNGELVDHTPARIDFRWRDRVNEKIIFQVKEDGYESWSDTITQKPRNIRHEADIVLERIEPDFKSDSIEHLFAFDRLVANFKEGKKIGVKNFSEKYKEDIVWEGSIKQGSEDFEKRFYDKLNEYGIPTVFSESSKLFSDDPTTEKKLPRFILGVELIDYSVNLKLRPSKVDSRYLIETFMLLKWSILDKATDEVALELTNSIETRYRIKNYSNIEVSHNLLTFEKGLINLIKSDGFKELLDRENEVITDEENISNKELTVLNVHENPSFESFGEMVSYLSKSCLTIITDRGHGSGAFVREDGLILTAFHVVEGVNKVEVKLPAGITLKGKVVKYNKKYDVALIRVEGSGFQVIPIHPERFADIGEDIFTIGTPADIDLGQSVARGIISGQRKWDDISIIQTDLAVSPGNSGGPLLNSRGEIIGIVVRKKIDTGVEGIGFSIPSDLIVKYLGLDFQ